MPHLHATAKARTVAGDQGMMERHVARSIAAATDRAAAMVDIVVMARVVATARRASNVRDTGPMAPRTAIRNAMPARNRATTYCPATPRLATAGWTASRCHLGPVCPEWVHRMATAVVSEASVHSSGRRSVTCSAGTGNAASMLLRQGEGLLSGLPFHVGGNAPNTPSTPNAPNLPATVVDTIRTATQAVTQTLPGANTPAQVVPQPATLPNDPASMHPRTPLQAGSNAASTQNTTLAHETGSLLRGANAHVQQASSTMTATQAHALQSTAANPARTAVAGETVHASMPAATNRSPLAEPALPTTGQRAPHGIDNPAMNTQAAAMNAARTAPAMQAVQAIQSGTTLTLAFAPQMAAAIDEGAEAMNHTALFRGQGADGAEGLRDILGRSYVFSADGKLATRADERREVDPVQASRTEAIDENSFANDGELSTHELVWKVVIPAFVGVGTLLGGAAVGAATAAGSSGMASAFLLVAAASILGYGAVRAGTALREMADAGQRIHPLENPAARTQWLAAGSQSLGSLASLALLLL